MTAWKNGFVNDENILALNIIDTTATCKTRLQKKPICYSQLTAALRLSLDYKDLSALRQGEPLFLLSPSTRVFQRYEFKSTQLDQII